MIIFIIKQIFLKSIDYQLIILPPNETIMILKIY